MGAWDIFSSKNHVFGELKRKWVPQEHSRFELMRLGVFKERVVHLRMYKKDNELIPHITEGYLGSFEGKGEILLKYIHREESKEHLNQLNDNDLYFNFKICFNENGTISWLNFNEKRFTFHRYYSQIRGSFDCLNHNFAILFKRSRKGDLLVEILNSTISST